MPTAVTRVQSPVNSLTLRLRLFRRACFRAWKLISLSRAKRLIRQISYEWPEELPSFTPAIILSTFSKLEDFLVLSYVFRDYDLTFLAPQNVQTERYSKELFSSNFILHFDNKIGFRFLRRLLTILRNFNRSIVISPDAARIYAAGITINPGVITRIAMKSSVPIIPVAIRWTENNKRKSLLSASSQCDVLIGKKLYVSPRVQEFRDVFFRRRGSRKFDKLPADDLSEIGNRIFLKLKVLDQSNGSNL